MEKKPFVTLEQLKEITKTYKTPFHLYDEKGIRENAKKLKEVGEYAPLSQIVLETDCPYLAPVPNRGKRNSSMNLPYVAEEIARIKGVSREEVEAVTWENALKLYRIVL